MEAKSIKKTCKQVQYRETELLSLIHRNLNDLKQTMIRGGKMYYITFIDDFLRYTKIYLLKNKDEVNEKFLMYKNKVENQFHKKIKRLRTNGRGEYDSRMLNAYYETHVIIHELTPSYSPEANGEAERKNKIMRNILNTMLISFRASLNLWGKAMLSTCHVQNRIPYMKIG